MDTTKNQAPRMISEAELSAQAERLTTPSRRGQLLRDRAIKRAPKKAPTNYTPPRKQRKKA